MTQKRLKMIIEEQYGWTSCSGLDRLGHRVYKVHTCTRWGKQSARDKRRVASQNDCWGFAGFLPTRLLKFVDTRYGEAGASKTMHGKYTWLSVCVLWPLHHIKNDIGRCSGGGSSESTNILSAWRASFSGIQRGDSITASWCSIYDEDRGSRVISPCTMKRSSSQNLVPGRIMGSKKGTRRLPWRRRVVTQSFEV